MGTPIRDKVFLWRSSKRGVKSRLKEGVKKPALKRDDVPDVLASAKMKRGDNLQRARLKYYPSIDVDRDKLYAGEIDGDLEDARDMLLDIGFRNNPTAYVEVTEENGPDDGSYAKQFVTETGGRADIPAITNQPALWKRAKRQIHVVLFDVGDKVEFLAHEEISAWLQPARHVVEGDATASIGVRDFRDEWYDEHGEELPGRENVMWETTH